jgi:hypothetical protein
VASDVESRLVVLRGPVAARRHNARTIAALTGNPGCARRAVLDSAGIDKAALARAVEFPAPYGQSQFAITRGNAFEARMKADGCSELLQLLRETLGLDLPDDVTYTDLETVAGADDDQDLRHAHARTHLATPSGPALYDHPLLKLRVAGQDVFLEPDLVAFQVGGRFHVVEIKSFPIVDRQADPAKVAAAATQAAVYVLALRRMLGREDAVAHDIVLVCPSDFGSRPIAVKVDVRRQLSVLEHQLARMVRVERILSDLPEDLTFRLDLNRPADQLGAAISAVDPCYAPSCLSSCELAYFCRHEGRKRTASLGTNVREDLGGVETIGEVLALADGDGDGDEVATMIRTVARVYAESLGP